MRRWSTGVAAACLFGICSPAPRVSAQQAAQAEPVAHIYRQVDGAALKLYVFTPAAGVAKAPAPAILMFHGGGWSAGDASWTFNMARKYAEVGFVAVSVDYRLSDERITP